MTYIVTASGKSFDFEKAIPTDISIQDIAASLSKLNRWNGSTSRFYSVAQHCVHMSQQVSSEAALWALMHDAAEAYIGDIPSTIKTAWQYEQEAKIQDLVLSYCGITLTHNIKLEVKVADLQMAATERQHLIAPNKDIDMDLENVVPFDFKSLPQWGHKRAEKKFLDRFMELTFKHEY